MVAAATAAPPALVVLQGFVSIGPTSAACIGKPSCVKPAGHALLEFTRASPSSLAMAETDARGHYRLLIAPGTWMVRANKGLGTRPAKFIVRRVRAQTRNFRLDSGVR